MSSMTTDRGDVLADWLDESDVIGDDFEEDRFEESRFSLGQREWMVLTDEEANERARDYIEQSLWAFNASFLVDYLPDGVGVEVVEALQPQYDGANEVIRSMVGDRFSELVEDAISADGRGHFLNTYDGNEHEHEYNGETWYVYRVS